MNHNKKCKLLFISHDATRSGAPLVVLYLIQWLRQNCNYEINVLLLTGGPLIGDFEKAAHHVYIADVLHHQSSLINRVVRKFKGPVSAEMRMQQVGKKIDLGSYDLVYGNTIISLPWLLLFKRVFRTKILIAIHELQINLESRFSPQFLSEHLPELDKIIAGSQAVAKNLAGKYSVPLQQMSVVHAFIHTHVLPTGGKDFLQKVGIPEGRFIIGGVGNPDMRKGVDLIVPLCSYLRTNYPDFLFHFLWVGGRKNEELVQYLQLDIDRIGLSAYVTMVESTAQYLDYMNHFDLFVMLSREDPFPLVSLEAAYLQKPIAMFEDTGGTAELLVNGGGVIVPYLNIEKLANAVVHLSDNKSQREVMGRVLNKEVVEKYNSEVACKTVFTILEDVLH